VNPNKV
jgi:hypothetical protein